jgi:hypothetical protein
MQIATSPHFHHANFTNRLDKAPEPGGRVPGWISTLSETETHADGAHHRLVVDRS